MYGRAQCADYNTVRAEACHRQASARTAKQAWLKAALASIILYIESKTVYNFYYMPYMINQMPLSILSSHICASI